jgi:hypothetical protein
VKPPPKPLRELLDGSSKESKFYKQHIRQFNSKLAFASLQADVFDFKGGLPVFKMHGESYHRIGNILPSRTIAPTEVPGEPAVHSGASVPKQPNLAPQFLALYFYDPEVDDDSELDKRAQGTLNTKLGRSIMEKLQDMMKKHNIFYATIKQNLEEMSLNKMKLACLHPSSRAMRTVVHTTCPLHQMWLF